MHVNDLDTPALLIDVNKMESNLRRVASYAQEHGLRLRPHTKTHKIPELGRLQLASGASGLTVAKVSEAEVMMAAQPPDLLIAYPLIGNLKLQRLLGLPDTVDVTIAVDSDSAARQLSEAAAAKGREFGVLAEVDVGLRRVGVEPGTATLELAKTIDRLPSLDFRGIAFYPGHIKTMDDGGTRTLKEVSEAVSSTIENLERAGLRAQIVSGGSTPALFQSHLVERLNEIRPGTYIFNDRNTALSHACGLEDCAASILTTVVSTSVSNQIIIDGGSKTFSSDRCVLSDAQGFGYFPEEPDAILEKMNEEHGFVNVERIMRRWRVGDRIRVIPNHICVAMNLHEYVYGISGEEVVATWKVEGRGKLQ